MVPTLGTAVLAASVAILVAVVTQVSTWRLERRRQNYERRRASLLEMQDQALAVRLLLVETGQQLAAAPPLTDLSSNTVSLPENAELVRQRSHAERLLQVRISRIEDAAVRRAVSAWLPAARIALLSQGDDDVTPADEETSWDAMCDEVRHALASHTPRM